MDENNFFTFLDALKERPSGYGIFRDGEFISMTQNELEESVFFYYDKLGQSALDEAACNSGKTVTDEQREKLLQEITLNLGFLVNMKIREIAENIFSD